MGGFRSQPDLTKHTTAKDSISISYAVSHMCGSYIVIQDGEIIWKMPQLLCVYRIKKVIYLEYSMDMEVVLCLFRSGGGYFCLKTLCEGVGIE